MLQHTLLTPCHKKELHRKHYLLCECIVYHGKSCFTFCFFLLERIKIFLFQCWNSVMNCVDWNKKQELLETQCLKHLKQYSSLFAALTTAARSQLNLIIKIQNYCYDNTTFMKVFHKIIILFYKSE